MKFIRVIAFTCVVAIIAAFIYNIQARREKEQAMLAQHEMAQKAKAAEQVKHEAEQAAATNREVATATAERQHFLGKYVNTNITKKSGSQLVAVAVESENHSMNHTVAVALMSRFKADHVQLTDSFFKPELVTDDLFGEAFKGSTDLFGKLELTKSLDSMLLGREEVQYSTNPNIENTITANMSLEIVSLPVAGQIQSQSWTLTAAGIGFRREAARLQAEERIIQQIQASTNMSLGF